MKQTLQLIQTVRVFLIGSILLYFWIVWKLPSSIVPNPFVFRVLTVVAVLMVIGIFLIRKIQVLPAEASLATQTQDASALLRLRQGYLVTYVLSEAIVLYGVALHFLGNSLMRVTPFFLAGLVLMLYFGPKRPAAEFPPDATVKH